MKKRCYLVLCILSALFLIGCGEKEGEFINLFYLNMEGNTLVQEEYVPQNKDAMELVAEVLEQMRTPEDPSQLQSAIPNEVKVQKFSLNDKQLDLDFNEEYFKMEKSEEVLLRAAVVQSLTQIPQVESVSFAIDDKPLQTSDGKAVGLMRPEDFVQNTGSSLKSYQTTDLKLYFSNKEGSLLDEEKRDDIHYNINTSMEKLVVEQLMKGPASDKRTGTIPQGTKLLGVSVKKGICYVNFDSAFLTAGYNQKPEVTIYSIVNSIIENSNANRVQILIDGASDKVYQGSIDLSDPLEWNEHIIKE